MDYFEEAEKHFNWAKDAVEDAGEETPERVKEEKAETYEALINLALGFKEIKDLLKKMVQGGKK